MSNKVSYTIKKQELLIDLDNMLMSYNNKRVKLDLLTEAICNGHQFNFDVTVNFHVVDMENNKIDISISYNTARMPILDSVMEKIIPSINDYNKNMQMQANILFNLSKKLQSLIRFPIEEIIAKNILAGKEEYSTCNVCFMQNSLQIGASIMGHVVPYDCISYFGYDYYKGHSNRGYYFILRDKRNEDKTHGQGWLSVSVVDKAKIEKGLKILNHIKIIKNLKFTLRDF